MENELKKAFEKEFCVFEGTDFKNNPMNPQLIWGWIEENIIAKCSVGTDSNKHEPLVMQLAAFVHFLCQYHQSAKETRDKIAMASTLDEARSEAMFDYPIVQGFDFNMNIYTISQSKIDLKKDNNIQKAVKFMLGLSSQSA